MKSLPFFAKILLFGEYGIILDSRGLSIPCYFFKGALKITKTNNDIISKRPGTGISPIHIKKVIGKKIKRNLPKDSLISFKDLIY